jgi:probable O-glycosylation ligase (exosortase A-associated)
MRDAILSLILVGLMPACFMRPFVGLCVFSWLAYMRVQDLTYGFAREQRWSFFVAILMFAGYFTGKAKGSFFQKDVRCYLLIALAVLVGLGVAFADHSGGLKLSGQIKAYVEFAKIIGVALFTTGLIKNREQLRVMLWVIALSFGFYGIKGGLFGVMGGSHILQGPGGLMKDNNDFALAMAMCIPMLFQLGWTERRPQLKRAFWIAVPMTVFAVGLTRSRGGFLSVLAAASVLVWRSRNRMLGISIGMAALIAALFFAPQSYKDRLETITAPTEDGSANSRLVAWGIATRMATDNPALGVGLDKFRDHFIEYAKPGETKGKVIVAHSSYFQIWAECGTPALLIYFFLLFSCIWTCWQIRRKARSRYFSSWIISYSIMFEATLVCFMVGATFLNRGHFDLIYHWMALIVVFGRIANEEMDNELLHPIRVGSRGIIQHAERRGFRALGSSRRVQPMEV